MRALRFISILLILILGIVASKETHADKIGVGSFSFVVIGHVLGTDHGKMNLLLDELLHEVKLLHPDMIFLTGDLIWGYTNDFNILKRDWNRLDYKLEHLGVPIYRVPGNHDITYPSARDIYFQRYGELPQAITYKGSRFILLNSSAVPQGNSPAPYEYFRGKPLDSKQIEFIKKELSESDRHDHIFLFMHHLLWWNEDSPWWQNVHPVLAANKVRAVFGGDHGPMKFSHMKRGGIDYIQTGIEDVFAIENPDSLKILHASYEDRLLASQFDNYLYVRVKGPQISIEVKTVGALSSGKFSPQRFRDVNGDIGHRVETSSDKNGWNKISVSRHSLFLMLIIGGFLSGVITALAWIRWKNSH